MPDIAASQAQIWSKTKDVLTVLVIPALIWVFTVSADMESQRAQLKSVSEKVVELRTSVKDLQDKERVISLQLARIETQLETIQRFNGEIHTMLRQLTNNKPNP
jgi:Tfp pilus assembly protein PilO